MELDVLSSVPPHPNLVRFLGAFIEDPRNIIIFQELVDGPNLERFLSHKDAGFDLGRAVVYGWTLDILRGLDHLHSRDPIIIHRDVKPDNMLLSKDLSTLKLADFGTSKQISGSDRKSFVLSRVFSVAGTPRYMAPEIVTGQSTGYTEKADLYSASLVIYYIATGRKPIIDVRVNPFGRPDAAFAKKRWPELGELLVRMWDYRPEHRPAASECVSALESDSCSGALNTRGGASDEVQAVAGPSDKKKLLGSVRLYKLIRSNSNMQ